MIHIFTDGAVGVMHPDVQVVGPFGQGIVKAHLKTRIAYRFGEHTDNVFVRACHNAVPVGLVTASPQAIAIMMLGYQHHIFGTRLGKKVSPLVRIPVFGMPRLGIKGV